MWYGAPMDQTGTFKGLRATSKSFVATTLIAALGLQTCGRPTPSSDQGPAHHQTIPETRVSGLVWRNEPVAESLVIIRDENGVVIRGRTDPAGRFDIAIGLMSGLLEITSNGLRQRVPIGKVGESVSGILLSPVGTLAEAYVDSLPRGRAPRSSS